MIPFKGAIFDLDGTLLDSLYVWRKVDERFFGVRRIEVPGDYSRAVSGMSFGETVAYTIQRFGLKETPEEVIAEWLKLAREEYAERVRLVEGARGYLRMLKRAGVSACPADAAVEIKEMVDYVSHCEGGKGCVRDVIEQVLRLHGKWFHEDAVVW